MIYLLIFFIGACIGSFLGVCIDRIPKNESIIFKRSHCVCGKIVPFYLNVPILSWILLRGKAKCCAAKIPIRYFIIEVLSGSLLVALWTAKYTTIEVIVYSILIFSLLVASFIDYDTLYVPNSISILLTISGIFASILVPQIHGTYNIMLSLQSCFLGLLTGSGLLFWIGIFGEYIFKKEAIGLGDVQLIGSIGTFCGFNGCLIAIFGGSLIGTIILLPKILKEYLSSKKDKHLIVPFVPFLTIGTIIFILLKNIINFY